MRREDEQTASGMRQGAHAQREAPGKGLPRRRARARGARPPARAPRKRRDRDEPLRIGADDLLAVPPGVPEGATIERIVV